MRWIEKSFWMIVRAFGIRRRGVEIVIVIPPSGR